MRLIDGGFVANNPALFALTDACSSLGMDRKQVRLLSIGTGKSKQAEHRRKGVERILYAVLRRSFPLDILETTMSANANSTDISCSLSISRHWIRSN